MKKILTIVICYIITNTGFAQKTVSVSFEKIKEQCKDLPLEKRVRVTVSRFSVTTTAPEEFGGNLATMLSNTLQGVNCYNVLLSLKDKDDINGEIDYGDGDYAKKSSSPKKGKQLGAQVVITGEITEYSVKNTGVRVGLVKVGGNKATIGFILKMINPETRETIYSQSISVEGKAGGGSELGAFGINVISSQTNNPALSNACEQGIIKAVEFLASKKDSLHLPENTTTITANSNNETELTLTNANFSSYTTLATLLTSVNGYKSMEKSLKSGIGSYVISHTGSSENFLDAINKKLPGTYEVIGFEQGKIEIKVK